MSLNKILQIDRSETQGFYVYDVESYPNAFTITIFRPFDAGIVRFEITERVNQGVELFSFLMMIKETAGRLVGFNNVHYDYVLIHRLLGRGGHITAFELWTVDNGVFHEGLRVWDSEVIIPQVDLYKIHHFDNKARRTGLKTLEFNMRSESVEDLPFKPNTNITLSDLPVLINYNDKDVFETTLFFLHSLDKIQYRDKLSAQHGKDFTNHNDTKIGKDYFIMELEKNDIACFQRVEGRKEPIQTLRTEINLGDAVIPWLQFNDTHFQRVLDWFRTTTIKQTKGAFEFIEVSEEMALESMSPEFIRVHGLTHDDFPDVKHTKTFDKKVREKGFPLSECRDRLRPGLRYVSGWKDQSGLNCISNGFQYDFGTGGIHGSVSSTTVLSCDKYAIIDLDVASYYPNIAIMFKFFPAHFKEKFCEIYAELYNVRVEAKKRYKLTKQEHDKLIVDTIKLALNGTYGDSNNPYSPFFDSLFTMKITINGQLLLCLLAEYLSPIQGLTMIQINTDGLTVKIPRDKMEILDFVSSTWEQVTGLELEKVEYSRMFIRDVNNYIAEKTNGELKRKGAYCYGKDLDWHQNHSSQVVQRAAEAALIHNADIEQFIRNREDIFDFMMVTKVPKDSKLLWGDSQVQNITRYYVSTSGHPFTKVMPPTRVQIENAEFPFYKIYKGPKGDFINTTTIKKESQLVKKGYVFERNGEAKAPDRRMSICAGWNVTPCNHIGQFGTNPVNYDYYIQEARKLVDPLR